MPNVFNAEEALEMACRIEHNGGRYYRRAAELVQDARVKDLLGELAAMEDDHELTFATLLKELPTLGQVEPGNDEAAYYLKAVADANVFPVDDDAAGKLSPGVGPKEVLQTAIGMEKESIVFYIGIRDAMPAALGRDKLEMIIREEMHHVRVISDMLSEVARA